MTFEQWMKAVDAELLQMVGTVSGDLPDSGYYDGFEGGMTPYEMAIEVMVENDIPC